MTVYDADGNRIREYWSSQKRRLPAEPLLEVVAARLGPSVGTGTGATGATDVALAKLLGVTGTMIEKWRQHGMTDRAAEKAAMLVGLEPGLLWSTWYQDERTASTGKVMTT